LKTPPRLLAFALFFSATASAEDIRVLVSNNAGARAHDPAVGAGYVVRPAPHVDLNVVWNPGNQTFTGGFRTDDETPSVQYGPEDALAYLPVTGQRQRNNAATQYDFQGAIGDTFWVFPSSAKSSNDAFSLYLGFSAYGVARDGTFTDNRTRWTVHSVENLTTPSATAFYGYSVSAGSVNMQLTLDPAYPNREMTMLANGHAHLNLLFKAPGMYRITFRIRGTLVATGQEVSSLLPVYFGVEEWEIPPATITYDDWRLSDFSPQQAADPAISSQNADPDLDGFTNLEEYAFGGDPLVPDAPLLQPRIELVGEDSQLHFRRRHNASDLLFIPEATTSLAPESQAWSATGLTELGQPVPAPDNPEIDTVIFQSALPPSGQSFQRVRVQLTPAP
jgi:surface-anchored protein